MATATLSLPCPRVLSARTVERLWRRAVREEVGAHANCRIVLLDGAAAPVLTGRSWHYVTPGGRPVYYPSAYRRHFGRPTCVASTLRVVVGRDWTHTLPAVLCD